MLGGNLLIAQPQCQSDYFKESVILMVDHHPQGAWGLVINKPMKTIKVRDIAASVDVDYKGDETVFMGGPVENRAIHILHTPDEMCHNSIAITGGAAVTSSVEMLHKIARGQGPAKWNLIMGIAGWTAGQLEGEMAGTPPWTQQHKWLTLPCFQHLLDYKTDMLWKTCVKLRIEESATVILA